MQNGENLDREENEMVSALKSLSASPSRADPIAAAFAAGRRSTQTQLQIWRATSFLVVLICIGAWASWSAVRNPAEPNPTVANAETTAELSDETEMRMTQAFLAGGIDN